MCGNMMRDKIATSKAPGSPVKLDAERRGESGMVTPLSRTKLNIPLRKEVRGLIHVLVRRVHDCQESITTLQ
jgi:hypothetical protein